MMRIPLAERMFEGVFMNASDKDLNQMYDEVKTLREKYNPSFRSLIRTPFIKQAFEMIEDEWEYRNQMMIDNGGN
jgi:hypothetical protein